MTLMFQLMRAAVDYAGLFPPAGLPLNEVIANYSNYLQSGERSMLGRLIVPASRLGEYEAAAEELLPRGNRTDPWRISALAPPIEEESGTLDCRKFSTAVDTILSFNERHQNDQRTIVDAMEVPAPTINLIKATIERRADGVSSFLEIPDLSNPEPMIEFISQFPASNRIFAKIRTGGITADLIPPPTDVARFIAACAKHEVGFKATAGLHHPIRSRYRLTYEDDAPESKLFGFLNVFIATMIAFEHRVSVDKLVEILSCEDPLKFGLDDHRLRWDNLEVSAERVAEIRKRGIISFGSCSFLEPSSELQQLPNVSHASVFSDGSSMS